MKKKSILACGLALILLAGCAQRDEGAGEAPREEPLSTASQMERESSIPEDSYQILLGEFSFWFPKEGFSYGMTEPVVAKEGILYSDAGESARVVAELISVSPITDSDSPFLACDQLYSEAENTWESTFGEYAGKGYLIQKPITEGAVGGYDNTVFYCIAVEDQLVTIAFYPAFGLGIGTQREEFETVLSTIQKA